MFKIKQKLNRLSEYLIITQELKFNNKPINNFVFTFLLSYVFPSFLPVNNKSILFFKPPCLLISIQQAKITLKKVFFIDIAIMRVVFKNQ